MTQKYQFVVYTNGHIFKGIVHEWTDEEANQAAEQIYDLAPNMNKFKLKLETGGYIVLGEAASQSAAITLVPVKA